MQDLAKQVVAISKGGLERRGQDEAHFIRQLEAIAETGLTLSDQLVELYKGRWHGSVEPVYDEFMY